MNPFTFPEHPVHRYSHTLTAPALDWVDGHILGNGDIGAVVWGTPERINIGLSKFDVWNLEHPYPEHGNQVTATFPKILEAFRKGDQDFISVGETLYAHAYQVFQQSAGVLELELLKGQPLKGMSQTLDFAHGRCIFEAIPSASGFMWGQDYQPVTCETIVHTDKNLVLVKLSSAVPQRIRISLSNHLGRWLSPLVWDKNQSGEYAFTQKFSGEKSYSIALGVKAAQFVATETPFSLIGDVEFGGEKGDAWLTLTCESAGNPASATQIAFEGLASAGKSHQGEWVKSHQKWWEDFWMKSAVEYEDEEITRLWYMGIFALASSTRPHTAPPHLQGVWNQYTIPPWHTDYHFNVNVQECHWPAASSNHLECETALTRAMTQDWAPHFRHFAKAHFEAPGLMIPLCGDLLGRSLGGWAFDAEFSTTAWMTKHLYDYYRYSGDIEYLEHTAYPFMQEVADFYLHHITPDDQGKPCIELSNAPEQYWYNADGSTYFIFGKNPAIDVAFIGNFLSNFCEAGKLLGVEDKRSQKAGEILADWPEIPTFNGHIIDYEVGYFRDGYRPGHLPHCHRHPCRLSAIFPCEHIGLHSDEDTLEMGRRSLTEFQSYGISDFSGWSYTYQACLAARLGMRHEWEHALHTLIHDFSFKGLLTSHNLMTSELGPLFQIEALMGAPAALNEALMQFAQGQLRLFPCIPAGKKAGFFQLRAPGGLLVSASHDGNKLIDVVLSAERAIEFVLINSFYRDVFHPKIIEGAPQVSAENKGLIPVKMQAGDRVEFICA